MFGDQPVQIYSLTALERAGFPGVARLPYSMKILLENLLRREDGAFVKADDIRALAQWNATAGVEKEISFMPARVLLQDFTGVPCVVDLAAMRDAVIALGGNPDRVNPLQPVELVIDHSVQVDYFGRPDAFALNAELEFSRNRERYAFLRWGQRAFNNFKVVPPDTGIVHQVNIEYLARVVCSQDVNGVTEAYPDTLVGTDSHTTMVNGLGVVGWGVGGIEAEAAMLGQPSSMLIPQVVGFRLTGAMPKGTTATDLVLTITEILRKHGVVGKFVEFFGEGLSALTIADRATLGNMCPEYGATVAIFPIDHMTLDYLRLTGREESQVALVEQYAMEQGLFRTPGSPDAIYSEVIDLNLVVDRAEPRRAQAAAGSGVAGQGEVGVSGGAAVDAGAGERIGGAAASAQSAVALAEPAVGTLDHGAVVIAAITSCTNTSNPSVMIGAGLVAKKAVERGLTRKPWVKSSLAPGSKVVTEYLDAAGLTPYLDQLGFNLVGYGCTTCIGNSGPLPEEIAATVRETEPGRLLGAERQPQLRRPDSTGCPRQLPGVAAARRRLRAGRMDHDGHHDRAARSRPGGTAGLSEGHLADRARAAGDDAARPSPPTCSAAATATCSAATSRWQSLAVPEGSRFAWDGDSTYVRKPTFLEGMTMEAAPLQDIAGARVLAVLGDSVTTDHISPAGSIKVDSPAGKYLIEKGVKPADFNSYGARRGNHEVMMRGTFANTRLRNQMAPGTEGGWTKYQPTGELMTIYDASVAYQLARVPLMVFAGKEYGSGSSRDWAAKGTFLLGVKAVIAESFERIHRSNLVNMGVLPLQFKLGDNAASLKITGTESFRLIGVPRA